MKRTVATLCSFISTRSEHINHFNRLMLYDMPRSCGWTCWKGWWVMSDIKLF